MNRSLLKRLEALESQMSGGAITLTMPDHRTRTISARRLVPMLREMATDTPMRADTQAVVESVSDDCFVVGRNHLTDLIRVMARRASPPRWISTICRVPAARRFSKQFRHNSKAATAAEREKTK